LQNPRATDQFVTHHAQAMSLDVCRKHIALYVNDFSVDLEEKGKQAVHTLLSRGTGTDVFSDVFNII
jgi:1,4-dihydroxy-6-naphthoate synthase